MKRQEHEEEVRRKIISTARRLFLVQGYEKTKIREIKDAAEVKIGTIYHFYQNKEDILANIARESFFRVVERAHQLAKDNKPLNLACELAWHIHTMNQHAPSAEIYLISYNSPYIAAEILANQTDRSRFLFGERFPELQVADHHFFAMVAKGMMQSITLLTANNSMDDPFYLIKKSVTTLLQVMNIPQAELVAVLQELHKLEIDKKVAVVLSSLPK